VTTGAPQQKRNVDTARGHNGRVKNEDRVVILDARPDDPILISKPRIVLPDSLLPIKKRVTVIVKAEIDSSGVPSNVRVIKSRNPRFNKIVLHFAKAYRFRTRSALAPGEKCTVVIPFRFDPGVRKQTR
jgi:TonB family protein